MAKTHFPFLDPDLPFVNAHDLVGHSLHHLEIVAGKKYCQAFFAGQLDQKFGDTLSGSPHRRRKEARLES